MHTCVVLCACNVGEWQEVNQWVPTVHANTRTRRFHLRSVEQVLLLSLGLLVFYIYIGLYIVLQKFALQYTCMRIVLLLKDVDAHCFKGC